MLECLTIEGFKKKNVNPACFNERILPEYQF